MCERISLAALREGECGYVIQVDGLPSMQRRLADLGLISGTRVTCVMCSPAGDPCAYLIRGALIALRNSDAKQILIDRRKTET